MKIESTEVNKLHLIRINPGDDLLLTIREAIEKLNLKNGFIINGIGSVKSFHYGAIVPVEGRELPKGIKKEVMEPRDLISITGVIIDGRVHAHIVLANDKNAEGGHLEEGTTVLYFTILAVLEIEELSLVDWDAGHISF